MKQVLIKSGKVYFHRREWFLDLTKKGWLLPIELKVPRGSLVVDKCSLIFVKV